MEEIELKHFVTYCDFGGARIARNIALNQAGVKTWYFTDSMNNGVLWVDTIKGFKGLHTFWAYLYYDCFVTWNDLLAQYYLQHPTLIKKAYVVGCLWSDHVSKKAIRHENESAKFVIAAFDSTYSQNGKASYQEGLAFAEHLLRLVDACPEVFLAFKEKKRREIHAELDAVQGPRLVALYETMRAHPKIKVYSNQDDAADLISTADMVIAFPFTSVTFEALSASKPAVWHDPLGYYKDTPYGKAGVVTHSYEELKAKVLEVMALPSGKFQSPLPKNSPLSDPYCDGKAIDRFRDLLVADL
jgi:polysaccharide biosynthesis PFTS motif protein